MQASFLPPILGRTTGAGDAEDSVAISFQRDLCRPEQERDHRRSDARSIGARAAVSAAWRPASPSWQAGRRRLWSRSPRFVPLARLAVRDPGGRRQCCDQVNQTPISLGRLASHRRAANDLLAVGRLNANRMRPWRPAGGWEACTADETRHTVRRWPTLESETASSRTLQARLG